MATSTAHVQQKELTLCKTMMCNQNSQISVNQSKNKEPPPLQANPMSWQGHVAFDAGCNQYTLKNSWKIVIFWTLTPKVWKLPRYFHCPKKLHISRKGKCDTLHFTKSWTNSSKSPVVLLQDTNNMCNKFMNQDICTLLLSRSWAMFCQ